jgi:hypothetical protein
MLRLAFIGVTKRAASTSRLAHDLALRCTNECGGLSDGHVFSGGARQRDQPGFSFISMFVALLRT